MALDGYKKERFRYYNSTVGVIKALEGQYTTIDLQNEGCVTGRIEHVDGYMNMNLEDVMYYTPRGNEHPFETFFVRARIIRYIHIPKNQPAVEIMENLIKNSMARRNTTTKVSYKIRRARRYHDEIVKSLHSNEEKQEEAS